jgi:NAD(P)-dependent dehydrogenase (short-subunit alcohol dehydrogenase family)
MKTILITGATDGIGKQTAFELAGMGHEIILHGRNESRGKLVKEDIIRQTGNRNIQCVTADFTDFSEIKKLAENIKLNHKKLDVLLNNAGVMAPELVILPNGFEKTFMVNHLAPFALSLQLLDLVFNSTEGRVVNVSSRAQATSIDFDNLNGEKYYDSYNAYALSKLGNVLFTYELARKIKKSHVTVNALHPGVINTKLLQAGWGIGGLPAKKGAGTTVYVSVSPELNGKSGLYFVNLEEQRSSAISYDQKIQKRMWELSLEFCGLEDHPFIKQ